MATELLLIDTDVLIDYSRGIEKTKGIPLVSKNRKDFRFINKLELIEYTV